MIRRRPRAGPGHFFFSVNPSSHGGRAEHVRGLFDRISGRYDLLNRIISFHLDTYWRRKAVAAALRGGERLVLDLGTGTGDLAMTAASAIGNDGRIVGIDFSLAMLRLAMRKKPHGPGGARIFYVQGTALAPPFGDETFDAAMTAFVLRNVTDLTIFFSQAYRVLKPGARLASLDMFPPRGFPFSFVYSLYFHHVMPWLGARLSGDREAYRYLSATVRGFHRPEAIADLIARAGFVNVATRKFLRGAVCLHTGEKPLRM